VLENEGARFSGDGVYLQRASITPNDSEAVHVANGPGCSASATPGV
jgi:hypothetical protein